MQLSSLRELARGYAESVLPEPADPAGKVPIMQIGETVLKPGAGSLRFDAEPVAFASRARFPILGSLSLTVTCPTAASQSRPTVERRPPQLEGRADPSNIWVVSRPAYPGRLCPCERALSCGCARATPSRGRGPVDRGDRRPARPLTGDGQGVPLSPHRRERASGQGARCRGVPRSGAYTLGERVRRRGVG